MSIDIEPFLLVVLGQIYRKAGKAAIVCHSNESYLIVLKKLIKIINLTCFHQATGGPKQEINPKWKMLLYGFALNFSPNKMNLTIM